MLRQVKDEIEGRHLALGAMEDADQYLIFRITAWKRNPAVRTEMEFEVVFSDDDVIWKHWDQDLATTV